MYLILHIISYFCFKYGLYQLYKSNIIILALENGDLAFLFGILSQIEAELLEA